MRKSEPQEAAGLEQLSTALRPTLAPAAGNATGLEEFLEEAQNEILKAGASTGPATSFGQLFPKLIEEAAKRNASEVVPQALLAAFRSLPTDLEKRHLTGSLGQAMMIGLHEFSEDFEPDPYPRTLSRKTIWTVTTSPTIDIDAKKKLANWADRRGVLVDPGGGGINIAIALVRRGVRVRPVFFHVGETGRLLIRLIENRGVFIHEGDAIELRGNEQTRVTIITSLDKAESLVPKGTPVDEEARRRMVSQLLDPQRGVQAGDIVAISGSLAPGLPESFYADLGKELISRGAIVVTDSKGNASKEVLFSRPAATTIYSQNNLEFAELVGVDPKDQAALIAKAKEIITSQPTEQGLREIVITEGAKGAFSVTRGKVLEIPAPKVEAVSEVGAGDTSLAERIFRAWQGKDHDAGFVYGVAAGTASVMHPGTGGGLQAEVDHFAEELGLTERTEFQPLHSPGAGLEETAVVREAGVNATAGRNRLVSVAMENRVLILGPRAIGALTAASHLVPTDGSSIPVVVVAENTGQADRVKNWALDLPFLSVEVVNAALPPYDGDVKKALEMTIRYYASEKGLSPIVARTLEDLPEIARRILGVPEPEASVRQEALEAQRDLERRNL